MIKICPVVLVFLTMSCGSMLSEAASQDAEAQDGKCSELGQCRADRAVEEEGEDETEEDEEVVLMQSKKNIRGHYDQEAIKAAQPTRAPDSELKERRVPEPEDQVSEKLRAFQSHLRAVKDGKMQALDVKEMIAMALPIVAYRINGTAADLEEHARLIDKNQNGKLEADELKPHLEPKTEQSSEQEEQEKETALLSSGGSWINFYCCTDYYTTKFSDPFYFKPRHFMVDGASVKGCYMSSFVFYSGCAGRFYSNSGHEPVGRASLCRCMPTSAWNDYEDQYYPSSMGNFVYNKR